MKSKLLFISVFFLFCTSVFSQAIDEFRAFYGTADSKFLDNPQLIGGGIIDVKNFNKIGFKLLKYLDRYEKIGHGCRPYFFAGRCFNNLQLFGHQ